MEEYLVPLETPCVYYDSNFLAESDATDIYLELHKNTPWEKTAKINRWTSLMELPRQEGDGDGGDGGGENSGDGTADGRGYKYRDAPGAARVGFPPTVHKLKLLAEEWYNSKKLPSGGEKVEFNVCLLNYYEDGNQRIGWHSDREEIGRSTPIASLSLGATRKLCLRSKTDGARDRAAVDVANGSIMVMENVCQWKYVHSILRQSDVTEGRINLTFRCKDSGKDGEGVETTAGERGHEARDNWLDNVVAAEVAKGVKDGKGSGISSEGAMAWSGDPDASANADADAEAAADGGTSSTGDGVFGDAILFGDVEPWSKVAYLIKTNIGAERYCAAETDEILLDTNTAGRGIVAVARPHGVAGYVACCRTGEASGGDEGEDDIASLEEALLKLRTAHHVLRYHDQFDLDDVIASNQCDADNDDRGGDDDENSTAKVTSPGWQQIDGEMMYAYYKRRLVNGEASVTSLADAQKGGTFRVTCDRIGGPHGFQAPEIEREVGGAMSEYYDNVQPKMSNYDANVRVDVTGSRVIVGTQINVDDLSKVRHFLRFRNAVTIKSNLAYGMIRCANIKPGDLVVDPFCGSGTILLEALEAYEKKIRCVGMDVSRRSANGARENASAEGCGEDVVKFHCCDARNFRKHVEEESIDAIVTNLPWGIMTGHKNVSDLQSMYEVFLRTAWYVLKPGARVVMLVLRGLQLTRIVRKLGGRYKLVHVNVVRTTNNLPSIVVVEKLGADVVHRSVKRQLAYLAQFVNVSSEIYNAVHYEKIDENTR